MFNPRPSIQKLSLHEGHVCLVVDDVLAEPERFVALAKKHASDFREGAWNAYPGPELPLSESITARLADFFAVHARSALGGRRTLRAHSRLALVTRPPESLVPAQWICHRDRLTLEPGTCIAASVLYLFKDQTLGGTSFYRPRQPMAEIERLVHDSGALPPLDFSARCGIAPGYMTDSNAWFERTATVPARYNRLILYRGDLFHSGDIAHPEKLTTDPATGRLSLNGFFTCRVGVG
jgi:hypothetical protein